MLNQPEQVHDSVEYKDSKDSSASTDLHHITDTDWAKENGDSCPRCKPRDSAEKAKRTVKHRAKVTVQRRANTNQKVVSLSFDKAVELTSIDNVNHFGKSLSSSISPDPEVEKSGEECMQQNADCDASTEKKKILATTPNSTKEEQEKVSSPDFSDVVSLTFSDKTETWYPADEVASFSTARDEPQHIAPPPIRLRQAWASPTSARQQRTSTCTKSKETNTEPRREHKQLRKSTTELATKDGKSDFRADNKPEPCSDSTSNSHEKPGSIIEGFGNLKLRSQVTGEPTRNPTTKAAQSKQKQRKRIDIKIPQPDQCVDYDEPGMLSEPKKHPTELTKGNTKTGRAKGEAVGNIDTETNNSSGLKSHGMGDAQTVKETISCDDRNDGPACPGDADSSNPDNFSENVTAKQRKSKKMGASLFSWYPFKRRSVLKQKTSDSKLVASSTKLPSAAYVAKTSMADILYMQGRVSMPQSLTAMFAASNPEKLVEAESSQEDPK